MTTSPHLSPSPAARSARRQPLRLSLALPSATNPVNGAWWPQSRDLPAEAADLVDHFPDWVGQVERLLYSGPDWDRAEGTQSPRRIAVARGSVKLGSFPRDDTHVMIAKLSSGKHLRLVVVPHDYADEQAAQVMRDAADDANTASPTALLGLPEPS